MDFVRKLVRASSSVNTSQSQQSNSLGIATLRRQFREVCLSMTHQNAAEQEEKLYTILPLFYKVFKNSPSQDIREKFGDVLQFSTEVSRLMVSEIRRRASNKSTEQASVDIANFLLPHSSENNSRGWLLLNTLSLLAAGGQGIVDCMTSTHLPSTLVKCLYLFFDLPADDSGERSLFGLRKSFLSRENRELLQKVFVQTLVRLCSYISPAEELSKKDDLALLFSAVTSWCSAHNTNWRSAASEILITISRHGLSHNVVQYIRSKQCIKTCINNLWRATVSLGENSPSAVHMDVDLAEQLLCVLRFISNTSEVTQLLLDDFRQHQGYLFISEFLLRLEGAATQSEVHYKALLSVIGSVENLTTCGFNEISPDAVSQQSFQTNFVTPVPIGKGESVRNIHAFQVLETLFARSRTTILSRAVLDAVFAVYCRDPANYFILANLNTMSSFSEKLVQKDPEIYSQYFAIFEYISLTLGFIPRKELVSISLLLKTDSNLECSLACLRSLQKLLSSNIRTYREVFREVGLFEMLVKCLQRYSALLKDNSTQSHDSDFYNEEIKEQHHAFGRLTMDVLVEMLQDSQINASIFRETGGARCAFNTLSYTECRYSALSLVEALILQPVSVGNDDDMATLLGILSTLTLSDLQLKIDILRSLQKVVSKSHAGSIMFRNVGGFINLISVIIGMEGYLSFSVDGPFKQHTIDAFVLLETVFHILTVTLASPSNEKFFENEINYHSLLSACKGLGCFPERKSFEDVHVDLLLQRSCFKVPLREQEILTTPHSSDDDAMYIQKILCFFKLFYMVSCNLFKDDVQTKIEKLEHSVSKMSEFSDDSPKSTHEFRRGYVLHPNFMKLFLHLISCIHVPELDRKELLSLQLYLLEQLNLILDNERNEQIMCEVGLLSILLVSFEDIIVDDDHPLNPVCQKLLERLATQTISPQELRKLLRVGRPLHCDNLFVSNGVVSLNRVKSLVSIATPRNIGMISDVSSNYKPLPAFIEFDLSVEGSSQLFIPSIFPQTGSNPTANIGVSAVSEERVFPPAHGISVAAWFYVERFCNLQIHPIRILTLERQVISTQQNFTCLSVSISPRRRRLIVSTFELDLNNYVPGSGETEDTKETAGFNVDHLCVEGQWHHVQVTLQRSTVLKHSTVTAYFNGDLLGASKLRYISTCPGGSSQQALNSPIAVHAWTGTPVKMAARSSLVWRLASLRVFDEISSFVPNFASLQFNLGPDYVGNYQNVLLPDGNAGAVFAEENLCFSLLSSSVETVTYNVMKRTKLKFDFKLLAVKLNIDRNDSLTPLDFFPNACVHTPGAARSVGAFAVGRKYKDSPRNFIPKGIGRILHDVGGISVALYLVAMATDVEGLYAAVKFLVCVLKSNVRASEEMEQTKGYQALGMHLKEKKDLLNSHILHLTFAIAGTVDTGQDAATSVSNCSAFEDLLCDLEIWHNAPQELHKSLFDHFHELLTVSSDTKASHKIITGFDLVQRCVNFMYADSGLSYETTNSILKVIHVIFCVEARRKDVICLGQFTVSLISSTNVSEKEVELSSAPKDFLDNQYMGKVDETILNKRTIHLRNIILELFHKCISSATGDTRFCENLENCLGFDWVLLFMQGHLHHSTVTIALRLLFTILQCSYTMTTSGAIAAAGGASLTTAALPGYSTAMPLIDRFRCGENFGGWLHGTDRMLDKKEESLLGFNVRSLNECASFHHGVHAEAVPVPGFLALQHLMTSHAWSRDVILLLLQFFVAQYDDTSSTTHELSVQSYQSLCASRPAALDDTKKILSLEISQVINAMLRHLLHQDWKVVNDDSWIRNYPRILIEIFNVTNEGNVAKLSSIFHTSEFLHSFILSLFPPENFAPFSAVDSSPSLFSLEGLLHAGHCPDTKLSTHPCCELLYAFLCNILWDSITSQKNKNFHLIDIILEVPADKNTPSCLKEYVTDVILHVIEYHVKDLDALMKSHQCCSAVNYLASRIVDKLWQGMFLDDCKKIFNFIIDLISTCQEKGYSHTMSILYRTLFRTILYQLSRRHFTISEQFGVLDALHCLVNNRNIVFGSKYRDANFLSCLCHCLFMISGDSAGKDFGLEAEQRLTTWHVTEVSKQPSTGLELCEDHTPGLPATTQEKGQALLSKSAARVWKELMSHKKDILSETFKVSFHDFGSEQANLDSSRVQIREAASKHWVNYLLMEKKGAVGACKDSPQQQLMKRMSNVVLGGNRKPKKDFNNKLAKSISIQDSHLWTLNHISVVQSLVRLQHNEHEQDEKHLKQYSLKEWEHSASELTRERGVWGPEEEESLTKWTLDSTEGPCRMRKRMMRDEMFYVRYPHRMHSHSDTVSKHRKPCSRDSLEYYRRINCLSPYYNPESGIVKNHEANLTSEGAVDENDKSLSDHESLSDTGESENDEAVVLNLCLKCQPNQSQTSLRVNTISGKENVACDICGLTLDHANGDAVTEPDSKAAETETVAAPENNAEMTDAGDEESKRLESEEPVKKQEEGSIPPSESMASLSEVGALEKEKQDKQDNQTILKLLEHGEKIRHMFRCARIQGLDVHEGLLLFGQEHYYIIDGFTMLKSREIRDISSLPGEHEPIIPSSTLPNQDTVKNECSFSDRMCSKFSYSDIREVHKRRYLLQNISLEVFNKDGRNCLLVFPLGTRAKVYTKFLSYATMISDRGKDSISGQRSGLSVEQQGPALFNLIGEKTVTSRWERGEISNFQYLMHLNTLAGRSYNDLMQYPVFPWIIADYDSEVLNLTNPKTFRDLSKPMGAQTGSRLEQYRKRYRDWEELGGIETPPYHYGTHYSSAMIVASYLVRMEPFTQHFLRLQGGHFDLADRMFHSIKDSWISASQKNMADVKELIPEFFYLPEFLLNTNRFDLGQKQNGVQLDDVILPAWARGSPHEFIRAHREALECDYVSSHLHEWIDLIFGYKQKGETALESFNVFHHLFYEGEVDIYSIKDPLKRNATIGFINNFGQIPKQLFKRPHPQKKVRSDQSTVSSSENKAFYRQLETLTTANPIKEIHGPVGHIVPHDRGIYVTEQGKMLIPPHNSRYISWGHKDLSVRVGYYESERAMQIFENLGCDEITCATMATEQMLITGDKSSVVHVWEIPGVKDRNKSMSLVKSLYGHTKTVTSVAACHAYGIIVTGAEDGSCILWDLNHLAFVRQLEHKSECPISHICINEDTGVVVTCAGTNLYQWSINGQLIAFASALSSSARNQCLSAIAVSHLNDWDPQAVVATGHSDGYVRFWGLEHVKVPDTAELLDLQYYTDSMSMGKKPLQHLINANGTPDTLSLASVGEFADMPWNDVSSVELLKHDSPRTAQEHRAEPQKTTEPLSVPAMKWKQQLVLKGKIELPNYCDSSGKSHQPVVTYIAMSKSHDKLYVGDNEGRVFAWTCS